MGQQKQKTPPVKPLMLSEFDTDDDDEDEDGFAKGDSAAELLTTKLNNRDDDTLRNNFHVNFIQNIY